MKDREILVDAAEHEFPIGKFFDGDQQDRERILAMKCDPLMEVDLIPAVVYGMLLNSPGVGEDEILGHAKELCGYGVVSFYGTSDADGVLPAIVLLDIEIVVSETPSGRRNVVFAALVLARDLQSLTDRDYGVSYFSLVAGFDPFSCLWNRPAIFLMKQIVEHGEHVTEENWRKFINVRSLIRRFEWFR